MDAKRRRSKADGDLDAVMLIPALKELIADGRSISQVLWSMEGESWKTRPRLEILTRYAAFYKNLFSVCPSGIILHSTLVEAITTLDKDLTIAQSNFESHHVQHYKIACN